MKTIIVGIFAWTDALVDTVCQLHRHDGWHKQYDEGQGAAKRR
jgi:hypothetical protein